MQRWLGAFPTPGPLPCSPDTIYEDCGKHLSKGGGKKCEAKGNMGWQLKRARGPTEVSPTVHQSVPRSYVQSQLHLPRLRGKVWSPRPPESISTRIQKVSKPFVYSFSKYLLNSMSQTHNVSRSALCTTLFLQCWDQVLALHMIGKCCTNGPRAGPGVCFLMRKQTVKAK